MGSDKKKVRQVRVTYNERTNCVIFTEDGVPEGYEVDLSTVTTTKGLDSWVHHLEGKAWMTDEALKKFVEIAMKRI
jgi:hypothetical protein